MMRAEGWLAEASTNTLRARYFSVFIATSSGGPKGPKTFVFWLPKFAAEKWNLHGKSIFVGLFDGLDFESIFSRYNVVEDFCLPSFGLRSKLDDVYEKKGRCRVGFVFMRCTVCFCHTLWFEMLVLALYFTYWFVGVLYKSLFDMFWLCASLYVSV